MPTAEPENCRGRATGPSRVELKPSGGIDCVRFADLPSKREPTA